MPDRDDHHDLIDGALARLAQATSAVAPDDSLTDAVVSAAAAAPGPALAGDDDLDGALARLGQATSSLAPRPALSDAVMAAAAQAKPASADQAPPSRPGARPITEGLVRAGPLAVVVALVAAAACTLLSVQVQRDVDDAVVSSVDTVEVAE